MFNYTELSAKFNRMLEGIWSIIMFLFEYTTSDAKDVTITVIDPNGVTATKTFPNIAKNQLALDTWKNDKEIYCSANRGTGWETFNIGDKFGVIGSFTENKGFTTSVGTGLLSGDYIVVPKTGRYHIELQCYFQQLGIAGDIELRKTTDKAVTSFFLLFIRAGSTLGTGDILLNSSDIITLNAGEELFLKASSGTPKIKSNTAYTHINIKYLGA